MKDSEIKALTPRTAGKLLRLHCIWRVPWYGKFKHCFTSLGTWRKRGTTLCGRTLFPHDRDDIHQVASYMRCFTCERKYKLLEQQADHRV